MFTGKVVAITGATGSLGKALTQKFVDEKAVILAIDKDAQALQSLEQEVQKRGGEIISFCCDLLAPGQVDALLKKIPEVAPPIDVWINNAGITAVGSFLDQKAERWEAVHELNFLVPVRFTRTVGAWMQKQGRGQIVNLASVAGAVPAPWMTAYTASKHALIGFTRALQEEFRQQNSCVELFLITPGFFESPIIQSEQASFPDWLRPLLGTPDQVASAILVALRRRRTEATPTLNGKVLMRLYRSFPRLVTRSSKAMLTKGPLDLILNRYVVPKN